MTLPGFGSKFSDDVGSVTGNHAMIAGRSAWLDGLRLFAAVGVWLFHLKLFDYGYLGVPLFFGISGFVIAQSAQGRTRYAYALARLARLWPAFLICLALTVAVAPVPRDAWTLLANITMAPRALGVAPVEGAYWSLMFEIIFYAYVAVFLIGDRFAARLRLILPLWLAASVANLVSELPVKVVLILEWGPYFAIGCATWLMGRKIAGGRALWIAATLVSAIAAAVQTRFDPVVAGTLVGVSGLVFPWLARPRPESWLFLTAGAVSYPLYLLHHEFGQALSTRLANPALSAALVVLIAWGVTRIEPLGSRAIKLAGARLSGLWIGSAKRKREHKTL